MDELLLASAGDDRRILLWSVPRALTFSWQRRQQQQEQQQQQVEAEGSSSSSPDAGAASAGTEQAPALASPLVHETKHKRKVNGMCALQSTAGGRLLVVADTGKLVRCYRLPC